MTQEDERLARKLLDLTNRGDRVRVQGGEVYVDGFRLAGAPVEVSSRVVRERRRREQPVSSDWLISVVYVTDDGGPTVDVWLREGNNRQPILIAEVNRMVSVGLTATASDRASERIVNFSLGGLNLGIEDLPLDLPRPIIETIVDALYFSYSASASRKEDSFYGTASFSALLRFYQEDITGDPGTESYSIFSGNSSIATANEGVQDELSVEVFDASASATVNAFSNGIGVYSLSRNQSKTYFALNIDRGFSAPNEAIEKSFSTLIYGTAQDFQSYSEAPTRSAGDPYLNLNPEVYSHIIDLGFNGGLTQETSNRIADETSFSVDLTSLFESNEDFSNYLTQLQEDYDAELQAANQISYTNKITIQYALLQKILEQGETAFDVNIDWFDGDRSGTSQAKLRGLPANTRYILGVAAWHDPATLTSGA